METKILRAASVALALALTVACEREPAQQLSAVSPELPVSAQVTVATAQAGPAAPSPAAPSLYELELELVDQAGNKGRFSDFRGHPVLVSMFYASCPYACPTLISDIKAIEGKLDPASRARLRVLLVTFDPARDTPAKLSELARTHGVDTKRWRFASASDDKVPELAAVIGIQYKALADGAFNHTSVITLLDERGSALAQSSGLGQDNEPLVRLLQGKS